MEPRCKYFGKCNGCASQHIDYEVQLSNKKEFLRKKLEPLDMEIPEIQTFSDNPYNYRNRIDFIFASNGLGLRDKTGRIIPVDRCEIANERINELLSEMNGFLKERQILNFDMKSRRGTLKYAVIRAARGGKPDSIIISVNSDSKKLGETITLIKEFSRMSSADNIIISRVAEKTDSGTSDDFFCVKGEESLKEEILGTTLRYHSQGFFQNNPAVAEMMVGHVKRIFERYDTSDATLLDMYGGVGTFGVPLSGLFRQVVILESAPQSIESAKRNILNNGLKNTQAIAMDVSKISDKKLEGKLSGRMFMITDPPRSGMDNKTIWFILDKKPECLIYVSCNPSQMAKELNHLKKAYGVRSLAIFDQFPQTNHIEAIAELIRI